MSNLLIVLIVTQGRNSPIILLARKGIFSFHLNKYFNSMDILFFGNSIGQLLEKQTERHPFTFIIGLQ